MLAAFLYMPCHTLMPSAPFLFKSAFVTHSANGERQAFPVQTKHTLYFFFIG